MRIGTPELKSEHGDVTWSVPVQALADVPDRLWFRLPQQHAGLITERADPAVIGLLIPAMHAAEPLEVSGPVTDELSHSVTHGYEHLLEAMNPDLTRVALDTPNAIPAEDPSPGVGTGFSAGVDSFAVLAEHHFAPVPQDLRLTHLMFFNVGSHDAGERGRRLFHARYDLLAPVTEEFGLPFVPVDSNLDDFYTFGDFEQTNGPRTLSAACLLQRGIGRYYFAGSFSYSHIGVRPTFDTAFSDPISLPLLTTRGFRPISHGIQYTRVEKTLMVADIPASHASLNVCTTPLPDGGNCSRCPKCLRTALTLEIAGRLEEYRRVFDLGVYRSNRGPFLDWLATTTDPLAAEFREHARHSGFRLPLPLLALARRGARVASRRACFFGRHIRRGGNTLPSQRGG